LESRHAESLQFLYDRINYEAISGSGSRYPFRLQRMRILLEKLGLEKYVYRDGSSRTQANAPGSQTTHPVRPIPLVHVAGTKGKGSTSTIIAAMLTAAGYRTGLYTSPHLHHLEERFCVDAEPCGRQELVELVDRIREAISSETVGDASATVAPSAPDNYSFFELTTALAFLHFERQRCDCIVLEVGLGGRLDSTNVCASTVTAITSIGLDHQHVLGNTLAEIAAEKAGIIKPGVPVVCGVIADESRNVIHAIAASRSAPVFQRGRDYDVSATPLDDWGTKVHFRGHTRPLRDEFTTSLSLEGAHQAANTAVAIAVIDLLRDQGLDIPMQSQTHSLEKLLCISRIERHLLPSDVIGIVDSAHNEDSIRALCETLQTRRGNREITVVIGTSRDKDSGAMLRLLAGTANRFVLTRFLGNPRFQNPRELLRLVPESHLDHVTIIEDPIAACQHGLSQATPGGMLVVCGSFFLAAETRGWMKSAAAQTD
jgi:dihydrofolate synthase / folylpolyglutamate synthase